jgi:2-phosphosulfolactate phosphatase
MTRLFSISCLTAGQTIPDFVGAVVCVDVIRATTTAVTSVALGRRCFPAASVEDAERLSSVLSDALLAGEVEGEKPAQFELQNSPTQLVGRSDVHRPLVLVSSSGAPLMRAVADSGHAYVACLRNRSAVVAALLDCDYQMIHVIGAASRGEFRDEDVLCCARIAEQLAGVGYLAADKSTEDKLARWRSAPLETIRASRSAEYLRRTGQTADLDFILAHDDDLSTAHELRGHEVVATA